jgi:undecaprenyl diphosphate synthase
MDRLDKTNLPRHIAIIMDGNGRWAQNHSLGRIAGHRKGAESVRNIVEACRKIGISYLTLYAFSSENWSRPEREVRALMTLLERYLKSEVKVMLKNNIRLLAIGDTGALPEKVRTILRDTIGQTAGNTAMTLILALNYGSHDEILGAVRKLIDEARQGTIRASDVTLERFAGYLSTKGVPDPDLLIRTSGEYRLSNFLLWQMAYTEFYFTEILWPDFREEQLIEAISEYQKRERRFGLTSDQVQRKAR